MRFGSGPGTDRSRYRCWTSLHLNRATTNAQPNGCRDQRPCLGIERTAQDFRLPGNLRRMGPERDLPDDESMDAVHRVIEVGLDPHEAFGFLAVACLDRQNRKTLQSAGAGRIFSGQPGQLALLGLSVLATRSQPGS